ncbi:hypothetical protein DRQ09_03490 [candidate division KSB1 bacterium]|nr:MAG: hypothetical protein DRQ09_03490 [candidate division KSB1 bacterium]
MLKMEITHQKRRYTNRVITLLTDFGYRDGFVGSMKGVILGINPGAQIVDISHEVQPQNIDEAGFILFSTYNHFPEGTIHVAVVDPGVGSPRKIIAVKTRNYIFLSPDNGLLKYIFFREKNCRVFEVTNRIFFLNRVSSTFHGRDIFAPVSAHLSLGTNINEIGKKTRNFIKPEIEKPSVEENRISGAIIHIDHFGNLITNISTNELRNFKRKNNTIINAGNIRIDGIKRSYSSVEENKPVALFSSSNLLEISINQGNAHKNLKLEVGDKIELTFE